MKPKRKIKEETVMIRRYCRTLRFLGSAGLVIALAAAVLSIVVGVASASDPQVWTTVAPMPPGGRAYSLGVVAGTTGNIYAIGGWNSFPQSSVYEYNPTLNSWASKPPMSRGRASAGVAAGSDGIIYVIGGVGGGAYTNTVEAYNPMTDTSWSSRASMLVPRDLLAAAAINGKIYAIGGRTSHVPFILESTVEEYDPGSDTWTTKSPMGTARHYFAAVAANGKIYAIGGVGLSPHYLDFTNILNTMEEYDPVGDRWTQSCMPGPRGVTVATAAPDGKIYVIGGSNTTSGVLNSVVRYDPLTKIWESGTTPTPIARSQGGAAAMADGKIYVMGGNSPSGVMLAPVEEYNPAADTWVVTPSDPTCGPPPDTTPPTTTANAPSAWQKVDFTVSLVCTDNPGGSGCKETKYRVDGGAWQTGTSILISTEGDHLIDYDSVDNAGNQESAKSTHAKLDKTPPAFISFGAPSPAPNALGWNNTNVSISFTATDNLSGVASTTPASPLLLTAEGSSVSGTVTVTDNAGNSSIFNSPAVKIDKTPITISGSRSPAPNVNGWNNTDVTVTFTCSDSLSGIDSCGPTPQVVGTEGMGQSRTGTAVDKAGNTASTTVSGINIDKTAPTITASATAGGSPYTSGAWTNGDVLVSFVCNGGLSGVGSVSGPVTVSNEGANQSATGSCTDNAGNSASATFSGINIDKTPPEMVARCAPPSGSPFLTGRDGLSGMASVALTGSSAIRRGEFKRQETYTILDKAGNRLEASFGVKAEGHETEFTLLSLSYNGGARLTLPENELKCEWATEKTGILKELEQKLEIEGSKSEVEVQAKFEDKKNETEIKVKTHGSEPHQRVTRPGLVFLNLTTNQGALGVDY